MGLRGPKAEWLHEGELADLQLFVRSVLEAAGLTMLEFASTYPEYLGWETSDAATEWLNRDPRRLQRAFARKRLSVKTAREIVERLCYDVRTSSLTECPFCEKLASRNIHWWPGEESEEFREMTALLAGRGFDYRVVPVNVPEYAIEELSQLLVDELERLQILQKARRPAAAAALHSYIASNRRLWKECFDLGDPRELREREIKALAGNPVVRYQRLVVLDRLKQRSRRRASS